MALILADRVLETCTSPGTGTVSLLGAQTGYQTFSAAIGNSNTCYYTIADQSGANWEVGIGTYATAGNTLARTTILSSSNGGSATNFSSGTQNVFATYPAERAVATDFTQTLTNKRITPRVLADTSNSATPTLNTDNYDMMVITGQSNNITSFTTNLTGTPTNGQKLWISITGTGSVSIIWGASFESSVVVSLPTTTVTVNRLDVGFVWNVAASKWRCVASA